MMAAWCAASSAAASRPEKGATSANAHKGTAMESPSPQSAPKLLLRGISTVGRAGSLRVHSSLSGCS